MKKITSLIVLLVLLVACNNLHVEKRHYQKGFYFSHTRNRTADLTRSDHSIKKHQEAKSDKLITASAETIHKPAFSGAVSAKYPAAAEPMRSATIRKPVHTDLHIVPLQKNYGNTQPLRSEQEKALRAGNKKNADSSFLLFAGLFAGGLIAALLGFFKRTKKLMKWAAVNTRKVRLLITASRIALALTAIFAGREMAEQGVFTSQLSTGSLSLAAIVSLLFYPLARKGALMVNYIKRQKIASVLIGLSGFLLITNVSNRFVNDRSSAPTADHLLNTFSSDTSADKENRPKELTKKPGDYTTEDIFVNIFLTLALLAVVAALLMLTAILSCNLSCSGQESLAALVAIGGLAVSIFLLIYLSILIWRPRPKLPQATS